MRTKKVVYIVGWFGGGGFTSKMKVFQDELVAEDYVKHVREAARELGVHLFAQVEEFEVN